MVELLTLSKSGVMFVANNVKVSVEGSVVKKQSIGFYLLETVSGLVKLSET